MNANDKGLFMLTFSLWLSMHIGCQSSEDLLTEAKAGGLFGGLLPNEQASVNLSQLNILRRDLLLVSERYVDSHLLDSELVYEMLEGALNALEQEIDAVRLVLSGAEGTVKGGSSSSGKNKKILYATVGSQTIEFEIPTLRNVGDLHQNRILDLCRGVFPLF